jgi:hypothetical protein
LASLALEKLQVLDFSSPFWGSINGILCEVIKRYVHGIYSTHYKATIGVDFALKGSEFIRQELFAFNFLFSYQLG